jgi:hypothetical protein
MKLYDNQRNAQVFNVFIYLLLPYMFWAFFKPIFRGRCTSSAVVQVSWVWCQRPGVLTPYPRDITLVIIQYNSKMHSPYNTKKNITVYYNNKTNTFWIHKIHDMNEVVSLHTEQSSPHHLTKDKDWCSWQCDTLQTCAIAKEWGKLTYQPQDFNLIQQNQLRKADMMVSKRVIMVGSYCYSRRKEIRHWNTKLWFYCCIK